MRITCVNRCRWSAAFLAMLLATATSWGADEPKKTQAGATIKVSYDKQIRPIFQARCQGCHQPAKAGGGYVMTAFDRMVKGGDSADLAIVPGKPAESHLVEQIVPGKDGKAEMPQNKRRRRPVRLS